MQNSIPIICLPILLWWFSLFLLNSHSCLAHSNETDRLALLAIKSQLHDPVGVTSSWNISINMCQWTGVTCGHRHRRVTKLDLRNQSIGGFLSPYVGNLSFLRVVNLPKNRLYGEIPSEIGHLSRLETLVLDNNSFSGKIPTNLSRCSNLINFLARRNNLVGEIPVDIGYLLKLERLELSVNNLTGQLLPLIGNLTALQVINIGSNRLGGKVPDSLGQLRSLYFLNLEENNFYGMFPLSVYNISSLELIALSFNGRLEGSLPVNIGFNLPNLKILTAGQNNLKGSLPPSLSNASNLVDLQLFENSFSGNVRIDFNNLPNLTRLSLHTNNLGTGTSSDLDFVNLLKNCSKLEVLDLVGNRFGGALPHSIANLSATLTLLTLGHNQLTGTIPLEIRNLVKLNVFGLEQNQLTGTIPYTIGELRNLQALAMLENNLHGIIPDSLGNLTLLTILRLGFNKLHGSLPISLRNCKNLLELNVSNNKLIGSLPPQILGITTLSILLDLSNNLFNGSIPPEVGNLKNLIQLDISRNRFSNEIPTSLSFCTNLEYLSMQGNSFRGSIPSSLISLKSIKVLDLSCNNLSGQIPTYLENLSFFEYLNLSYNHFGGEVPRKGVFSNKTRISLTGNVKLCGGLDELHLPACESNGSRRSKTILLKVIVPVVVLFSILLTCFVVIYARRRKPAKSSSMLSMEQRFPMVSYAELSKATNVFSSSNMIGQGSFGIVYKGNLGENGMPVAVKVMNLKQKGATKSFVAECEALRNIRHRNLIKIITVCSSIDFKGVDFKALVYEYMQYGSLEDWLHLSNGQLEVGNLNLIQRLNLVIDVASAIEYLHHHCQPPIVHGDLKPSNVLIDHDLVAHVSDFGLARFLSNSSSCTIPETPSSSIGIKGTVGYVAPEYGMGGDVSMTGDVYSFGIMLLEMFTRRRPTDNMFNNGLTLHGFAKMALPEKVMEIIDPSLLLEARASNSRNPGNERSKIEELLVAVVRIGVLCSMESSSERMKITDVVAKLYTVRNNFLNNSLLD